MRSVVKQSGRSQELMSLVDRWIEAQDCRHLWRQVPSWSVSCQQRAAQCLSQGDSRCNLAPRLQVQLGEDLLHVPLGCPSRDGQLLGDFTIAQPLSNEYRHLLLTPGESPEVLAHKPLSEQLNHSRNRSKARSSPGDGALFPT